MKTSLFCTFALLSGTVFGLPPGPTPTSPVVSPLFGSTIATTATITVGPGYAYVGALPPQPAYTVQRGTHLTFIIKDPTLTNPTITWYKDGKPLGTGLTWDIPSATPADTGRYSAQAGVSGNTSTWASSTASVLVNDGGQRLLNFSTRVHLDTSRPSQLSGFVVEAGPEAAMVLVRAVGPTLANFGVIDALAAPQLTLMDAAGRVRPPVTAQPIEGMVIYPTPAQAAAKVGAFPLPDGSQDVAAVYLLDPGAYTAQVSAPAGTAGTVLLEVYEVPLPMLVPPF